MLAGTSLSPRSPSSTSSVEYEVIETRSLPGIEANSPGRRERTFSPLGCKLDACERGGKLDVSWEDKQEAEAGVGKSLGSLVDGGFEAEPLEEDGKRWTGYTTAYDNDFGHLHLESRVRESDVRGGVCEGRVYEATSP
jgi:hypothetical protein